MSQTLKERRFDLPGTAYLMITCQSGSDRFIMDELKTIHGVKEIEGTVGAYDIVVKIESETTRSLSDTIVKIRKIPEIRTTTTVVCEPTSFC
jgi:nitrate reductase NapAB chaperone NapD